MVRDGTLVGAGAAAAAWRTHEALELIRAVCVQRMHPQVVCKGAEKRNRPVLYAVYRN